MYSIWRINTAATYVSRAGAVFARFSPHSHAVVAGLRAGDISQSASTNRITGPRPPPPPRKPLVTKTHLHGRRVGNLHGLFVIHEEAGGFDGKVPRTRWRLGEGVHWLAWPHIKSALTEHRRNINTRREVPREVGPAHHCTARGSTRWIWTPWRFPGGTAAERGDHLLFVTPRTTDTHTHTRTHRPMGVQDSKPNF